MKTIALLILLPGFFHSFAQENYLEYHRTFVRIDNDILSNDLNLASIRLDTIYATYPFIYAAHCIKALQICCASNDSVRAGKWLQKAFRQGVPLWVIRNNGLTSGVYDFTQTQEIILQYDSLHAVYRSSIRRDIAARIDSLLETDQQKTRRVNDGFFLFRHTLYGLSWLKNNKRQFALINGIIDQYGFPGERLIGLPSYYEDSAQAYKNIQLYGPSLTDHRTYVMLIHYYSTPRKDINDKLISNTIGGFLPPDQFGGLNDFMARYGKNKYGDYRYYNVWHKDPDRQHLSEISRRRNAVGLSDPAEQTRNEKINMARRKSNTANSAILLE